VETRFYSFYTAYTIQFTLLERVSLRFHSNKLKKKLQRNLVFPPAIGTDFERSEKTKIPF